MRDISHYYGGDLDLSPTGDLLVADETTTGEQRVYRRLLTNPALTDRSGQTTASADYIFHPDYGAGVPRYVGQPTDIGAVKSLIRTQIGKEAAVAQSPAPVIDVQSSENLLTTVIRYNDAESKQPVSISFDANK